MFSKIVRQTHMYTGLVLLPWILMYGVSTIVMNHRAFFKQMYGGDLVRWIRESERSYDVRFPENFPPRMAAEQILQDLNLGGGFNVNQSRVGPARKFTIVRSDAITPRRVTYIEGTGALLIEKQEFRSQPFLESLHRRRGYANAHHNIDRAWAISVDIAIAGMLLWIASGVWMWWELKVTRLIGFYCILAGTALFALFVVIL